MASFFRAGCFGFWLVWMCTLSFYFGVAFVQRRYSYLEIGSELSTFMFLACFNVIIMAFIGCCCVKCDVTHPCCAIWYIVITTVGTAFLCVLLMIFIRSDTSKNDHEVGDVMRLIKTELEKNHRMPDFIHHTQLRYECCGIYGFKDYRAFIFSPKIDQDVPHSCCKNDNDAIHDLCPFPDGSEPKTAINHLYPMKPSEPFLNLNKEKDDKNLRKYRDMLYGTFETFGPAPDRYINPKLLLPVNVSTAKLINLEGCYDYLRRNSVTILDYYFAFSLILVGAAFLLVLAFTRNCLHARRETHEGIEKDLLDAIERHESAKVLDPELETKDLQEILKDLQAPKKKLRLSNPADPGKGTVVVVLPAK